MGNNSGLTEDQLELLWYLTNNEGIGLPEQEKIQPREGSGNLPLSFAQQRMWFLEELETEQALYNIPEAVRFTGKLEVGTLQRSLNYIIRRHEALRTRYAVIDGELAQVISEQYQIELDVIDISGLDEGARERLLRRLRSEEARRRFDLGRAPLVRAKLIRITEDEHVFLLTVHHINADGWSVNIIIDELASAYRSYSREDEPALKELEVQYADYAVWQRRWVTGEMLDKELAYWKEQLGGELPVLQMPTDLPRPALQTYSGERVKFKIEEWVRERLVSQCSGESVTMFMILLTVLKVLLSQYSGQKDILVGTPIAGRSRAELEPLIGCFVNTLVIRTDLSGNPTVKELLGRVKESCLAAYANQNLPFDQLVQEIQPERDLSRHPLFQVMFVLQNAAPQRPQLLPNLTVSPVEVDSTIAKFDLTLLMEEGEKQLSGALEYRTDLFKRETILRMKDHLELVLKWIATDPEGKLSELTLLTKAEREQILYEWNDTTIDYGPERCLHNIISDRAHESPDSIALEFEERWLSYEYLNQRANQMANYLRRLGVRPESRVGVCLARSIELVVALLGVMKAGGAYVPLDVSNPRERLEFMTADVEAQIVIIDEQMREAIGEVANARIISVEREREAIEEEAKQEVSGGVVPDNAMYVMYTSGSTGKPKGVINTHRGVVNRLIWMQNAYGLGTDDRVLQKTPFSFDVSVWEFFWPLMVGALLVEARPGGHKDPSYLIKVIERERITTLHFVPSMLQAFVRSDGLDKCGSLKRVICSGEALSRELEKEFHRRVGKELHNLYGPTEAAIDVSCWECRPEHEHMSVPIGRPIANTQLYILDRDLEAVLVGAGGELHISGKGLARGYWNRPDLTAEKFLPHLYSRKSGQRIYQTGDLARYLPDGNIEFIGRIDHQVKVRGFRIELGEIESTLMQHQAVKNAIVMANENPSGGKRLVGYIVCDNSSELNALELQRYLKDKIPDYMIPSSFIWLTEIPVTTNGKIDRQALLEIESTQPELEQKYEPPKNFVEEALIAIWTEALGIERIGIHDTFFSLGGDSILSVRVLALAKGKGIHISLQQLFQHQTIYELSKHLSISKINDASEIRSEPLCLVGAEDRAKLPVDIEDAYPMTMLQVGMLYHIEMLPDDPVYHNVNSYYLQIHFDEDRFRNAAQRVVERHPILRTSFDLTSYSEPFQLVHKSAFLQISVFDIRHLSKDGQEEAIQNFIIKAERHRFDITLPPLLRFYVHLRSEETIQFTLVEFHAILDGWSLHSTLEEIFTNYFALLDNREPPASTSLAVTFRDYVLKERQALKSEDAIQYWKQKLQEFRPTHLPFHSSSQVAMEKQEYDHRISTIQVPISGSLSARLIALARFATVPIKTILLAAHLKTLSLVTGQRLVTTGFSFHGRLEERDGDKVRGLFLNILPLIMKIGEGNWVDLIKRAFEAELELTRFRWYPLAAVHKKWGGDALFEVFFHFTHFHVVNDLLQSGQVQIFDFKKTEETNFALQTHCSLDLFNSQVLLELAYDQTRLNKSQMDVIEKCYLTVLNSMSEEPSACHVGLSVWEFLSEHEISVRQRSARIPQFDESFSF
jgi:amino acid adenylation domain-containing protein